MAIEESSTTRKYETEYATAKAQGYTGTYAHFALTQTKAAPKKASAAENSAPKAADTDATTGAASTQSFEELLELVLLKPEQRTKAFSAEVDALLKASPTLKHLAAKLDTRLNPPPEPKPAEERPESILDRERRVSEEREAAQKRRFERYPVVQGVTLNFMRGYAPNFSTLPSGYVLAVHRKLGTIHPFYFKLYSEAELNPTPPNEDFMRRSSNYRNQGAGQGGGWSQPHRGQGGGSMMADGPNELRGLENYGVSREYLQQRISMLATELFNDDVFFCQSVVIAPTFTPRDDRVRLMGTSDRYTQREEETFAVNEFVNFRLQEGENNGFRSGWENMVRVCFPGEKSDHTRVYTLTIDTPFPEKFDARGCSAHWVAREIAKRLAYTHPNQIGRGVVTLELGGSFTNGEPQQVEVVL